jgi:hypothetical protein
VVPGASAIVLCILRTGFGRYVVLPPSSCAAPPISFRGERKPRIGCDLIRVRAVGYYPKSCSHGVCVALCILALNIFGALSGRCATVSETQSRFKRVGSLRKGSRPSCTRIDLVACRSDMQPVDTGCAVGLHGMGSILLSCALCVHTKRGSTLSQGDPVTLVCRLSPCIVM